VDLLVSDIAPVVEELPNGDLALDPFFGGETVDFVVCAFARADVANVQSSGLVVVACTRYYPSYNIQPRILKPESSLGLRLPSVWTAPVMHLFTRFPRFHFP